MSKYFTTTVEREVEFRVDLESDRGDVNIDVETEDGECRTVAWFDAGVLVVDSCALEELGLSHRVS